MASYGLKAVTPFGLVSSALTKHGRARESGSDLEDRRKRFRDAMLNGDPVAIERLRSMYPDFEEYLAAVKSVDYKYECQYDARFATKYRVPPGLTPAFVGRSHQKGIDAVRVTRRGFLTAGHDSVKIWEEDKVIHERQFSCYDAVIGPEEKFAVVAGPDGYELVNLKDLSTIKSLKKEEGVVNSVALYGGYKVAAGNQYGVLTVHDIMTGEITWDWTPHANTITGISWQDDNVVGTSSRDGSVTIWDTRINPAESFRFMPSVQGNAINIQPTFNMQPHLKHPVFDIAFLDSNTILTSGADNSLRKLDLRYSDWTSGENIKFLGHTGAVRKFEVSPDGTLVATCCENGSARVFMVNELKWRMEQDKSVEKMEKLNDFRRAGHSSAVFSLDGHKGIVTGCAWEDNSSLYTCSWDQTVLRFDLPEDFGTF